MGKENDVTNPRDAELKMSKEIGRGIMADIVGQEAYMPTKDVSKIYLFFRYFFLLLYPSWAALLLGESTAEF